MAENKNTDDRVGVINAVNTPLRFAALVVVVIEGLLAYLLSKADAQNISLYVILMVSILGLTIIAAFFIEFSRIKLKGANIIPPTGEQESTKRSFKWDVFLAAPMAAIKKDSFESTLATIKEIKKVLEEECGYKTVFFAGANMQTQQDFETADLSIETDVNAIKDSERFIMLYPEKIVSSVLFEAGIALALGKPSFYFGNTDNFPFLMKQANQKFTHVKIQEVDKLEEVITIIKKNKLNLFKL
jgi:nucleoside 2-deoxyribosyltransferase